MALIVLDGNGVARQLKTSADGSDLVPHHNVDSVANPVAATQSGAWNVSLTGTIPAIVPGTNPTNLGKAEDAAHTTGDTGVLALGVRSNTAGVKTDVDGDYHAILLDSTGRVHANAIRSADGLAVGAAVLVPKRASVSAAVGTDSSIVASVTSKRIRVLAVVLSSSGSATIVFNSKPAGAGSAISSTINLAANSPVVLPPEVFGWFETNSGEGLSATVGTTAVGVHILYAEV